MMKKLTDLTGVGEKRAKLFERLGVTDCEDLLRFFPRGYEDRTHNYQIAQAPLDTTVCVRAGCVGAVKEARIRRNMTIFSMPVSDDSGSLRIVWYNNRFVKGVFSEGEEYVFCGKITQAHGRREMINPVYESVDKQKNTGRIVPIYPLCEGLTQAVIRNAVLETLESGEKVSEFLPDWIRKKYRLCELNYAIRNIHFPESPDACEIARKRFIFEELFILKLALALGKTENTTKKRPPYKDTDLTEFYKALPFELTDAQKKVVDEIKNDLADGYSMNRLVQGDVGSGKTAVAACAIYLAVKNGYQAIMMAPTEILANQHYNDFCKLFEKLGMNVVLLTSSTKKKEILNKIKSGEADIIIGTHALIQKGVEFANPGLAVTDEQHRFGVAQRSEIANKGDAVNVLVMTATPIPRTLALVLYGDLNVSVIDKLPPGRKPVMTYAVGENMRKRVYNFLEKNVKAGQQAYIVCPLVAETEKSDLKNATDLRDKLAEYYPDISFGLVHGKMKPKEKDDIVERFVVGEIDVLVSTTVIEVGVNVPNSNTMIIENAERFGLSQLHQLRGRVGRGAEQAYCIMVAHGNGEVVKSRMDTMCKSSDGFYIAEQDLKLRGPGDIFGTRQHGLPELKVANLVTDVKALSLASDACEKLLAEDKFLQKEENAELGKYVKKIFAKNFINN